MSITLKTITPHGDTQAGFNATLNVEGSIVPLEVKYDIDADKNSILNVLVGNGESILTTCVDESDNTRPFIALSDTPAMVIATFDYTSLHIIRTDEGLVFDVYDKRDDCGAINSTYLFIDELLETTEANEQ